MKYEINAQNKKLGRVATEAATILMGKNQTNFARNKIPNVQVEITNVSKLEITNKKMSEKTYKFYSGYPGGLREPNMKTLVSKRGMSEVLRKAIYGMLPKNKLRSKMMLNLKISE